MAQLEHTTISGHRIAYEAPDAKTLGFIERARTAADDTAVTENDLIALIYSEDNPILERGGIAGRGMVTKDTLANPLYRVMQDLLDRKRIAAKQIDVGVMAARYSVPLAKAAEQLGVHVSALRQAVHAQRIPSWHRDGGYWLTPEGVRSFAPERRGPTRRAASASAPKLTASEVTFRVGGAEGASMRIKARRLAEERKDGRCLVGRVPSKWARIGVIYGAPEKLRFVVLEPSDEHARIAAKGGLFVDGAFRIASRINNPREAQAAWRSFEAE